MGNLKLHMKQGQLYAIPSPLWDSRKTFLAVNISKGSTLKGKKSRATSIKFKNIQKRALKCMRMNTYIFKRESVPELEGQS